MSYDDEAPQNPFTRPGFITATVVVAIILILGILVVVRTAGSNDPAAAPTGGADPSASVTPDPSEAAAEPSVCGLEGIELEGTVTAPPDTEWAYQGTTAYPSSEEFGPAAENADGVRHCFQHSPQGALVAAANALVQAADPLVSSAWAEYFVSSGPNRAALLAEAQAGGTANSADARMNIAGFRLLEYTGEGATVDIAVKGSADGAPVVGSFVYALIWDAGDWKLDASSPAPFSFAAIPDLAGYIAWGA